MTLSRPVRIAVAATVVVVFFAATPAVGATLGGKAPAVQAATAAVADAATGELLFGKSADRRRAIASTTKLMTALLVEESLDPDELCAAPRYEAAPAESQIGLRPGERMRADDLLRALLLESANDAAVTLAECVSGSEAAFVRRMNGRAAELGLDGTSYANPIGLDAAGNRSTARDLVRIGSIVMARRPLARIVGRTSATLASGDEPRTVRNRNTLVASNLVDGVKTGYTLDAGNVLVGSSERGGIRVVTAVLGEPTEAARDTDTVALIRYGLGAGRRARSLVAAAGAVATAFGGPAGAGISSGVTPAGPRREDGDSGWAAIIVATLAILGLVILMRIRAHRIDRSRR